MKDRIGTPGAMQWNSARFGKSKCKLQKNIISQGFNLLNCWELDHG